MSSVERVGVLLGVLGSLAVPLGDWLGLVLAPEVGAGEEVPGRLLTLIEPAVRSRESGLSFLIAFQT